MVIANVRVGCAGLNYQHWKGHFYPPDLSRRDESPFMRGISIPWKSTPVSTGSPVPSSSHDGGTSLRKAFAMRSMRTAILPSRKLKDCVEPIARMMSPIRHLRDRLGPVLYQLPPTLKLDLARLEAFLRLLPRDLVHVFEFRDPTWYSDAVLALLDGFGTGFVAHDFPDRASPRWACGNADYVRFHGATGKYQGRYAASTLRSWADWMIGQASARPVWAFFNNDIDAAAPDDAGRLRAMVG